MRCKTTRRLAPHAKHAFVFVCGVCFPLRSNGTSGSPLGADGQAGCEHGAKAATRPQPGRSRQPGGRGSHHQLAAPRLLTFFARSAMRDFVCTPGSGRFMALTYLCAQRAPGGPGAPDITQISTVWWAGRGNGWRDDGPPDGANFRALCSIGWPAGTDDLPPALLVPAARAAHAFIVLLDSSAHHCLLSRQ